MDYGYPQILSIDVLRTYINLGTIRSLDGDPQETGQLTSQITGAIDWRREGIRHRKNEVIFFCCACTRMCQQWVWAWVASSCLGLKVGLGLVLGGAVLGCAGLCWAVGGPGMGWARLDRAALYCSPRKNRSYCLTILEAIAKPPTLAPTLPAGRQAL